MNIKKVGLLYHPMVGTTLDKAKELESSLVMQGVSPWICSAWEKEEIQALLEGTDLLLTIGGDGTILRAVQAVIPHSTPITGINQGKLGFLTELDASEAVKKLPLLITGKSWIDQRSILQAELISANHEPRVFHALNDVIVARGEIARLIRVDIAIDSQPLPPSTLRVDGHINLPLSDGDTVTIKRSPHFARFFRIRSEDWFYRSLEDKLKGKQGDSGRE